MASPERIHGAVESAFSGERKRRLWRIDCLKGTWYLMIVSEDKPDLTQAVRQFGNEEGPVLWETKDYQPLLSRIREGDLWHFRLTANPTISRVVEREGEKTRGKVYAHLTSAQQENWLATRAAAHGFAVDEGQFRVVHEEWYNFRKKSMKKGRISILAVTYEGILCITNAECFRRTLTEGIGRGKAYGMGLLTIAGLCRKEGMEDG